MELRINGELIPLHQYIVVGSRITILKETMFKVTIIRDAIKKRHKRGNFTKGKAGNIFPNPKRW